MRLILFVLFIFSFFVGRSQFPITQTLGSSSTQVYSKGGLGADSGFVFRVTYADTTTANRGWLDNIPGITIKVGDNLYMRNSAASAWVLISGGGSGVNIYNSDGVFTGNRIAGDGTKNFTLIADTLAIGAVNSAILGVSNNYFSVDNTKVSMNYSSSNNFIDINGDSTIFSHQNGKFVFKNLPQSASTTDSVIVRTATGQIKSRAQSAIGGNTLYSGDGTIAGDRIVTGGGTNLFFNSLNEYRLNSDTSKFTALKTTFNGGNVGIGTTTPISKLQVSGAIRGTDSLILTGIGSNVGTKALRYDPSNGNVTYADTTIGGGSSNYNTSVGTGYRIAINGTNNLKDLTAGFGVIADSLTTNNVNLKVDSSVLFSALRVSSDATYMPIINTDLGDSISIPLSVTKIYTPAVGVAASSSVANYSYTSIDSAYAKYSTTRTGSSGSEYGGWLSASTSGDSVKVTSPFWVIIGDSQAEGHPAKHGRLHPTNGAVGFTYDYPDSSGQLSYHLRALTNMRWYNHGIGGQTTTNVRARFYRDVLGQDIGYNFDNRGTRTLSRQPQGVVIIVGINDVFAASPNLQVIKDNLEWMASVCQQQGIRCVMLNLPGDNVATQTQLKNIAIINQWLNSGVMNQYGCSVVDYNTWWNNPAYGNDNYHQNTSYIVDDIHPSQVGYDSLANYIFRKAKLPVLTKVVLTNELSPGGFTGYSRPAGITINGNAYTSTRSSDTLNVTTYVPDSVWIKVTSSTNVTGTSYSGFSHVQWFADNNPSNTNYYTKRTLYNGSTKANQSISSISIMPGTYNLSPVIDVRFPDTSYKAFQYFITPSSGYAIINGYTSSSKLNNASLSVYGIIGTNNNILADGTKSRLGLLEFCNNGSADTYGYGISANNTTSYLNLQTSTGSAKAGFDFKYWSGTTTVGTGVTGDSVDRVVINLGNGAAGAINQTSNILSLRPVYNQTSSNTGIKYRGIYYRPTLTSMTNVNHIAWENVTGDMLLGTTSGSVGIGVNTSINASAILDITSTTKGFLQPRMTQTQRDAIASPATGLQVYNTTNNTNDTYDGVSWKQQATWGYIAKTANYTALSTDYTIDCTSGTFTVTLPTAVGIQGREYVVKNSGTGSITVNFTSGQTADGAASYTLGTQYKYVKFQSNNATWIITANN